MEKFLGTGVVVCRPAVVVSIIFLLSCGFLQLARAQTNQSNIVLNIACGATQSYTDPVTGLTWVPDTTYITTGNTYTNLSAPSSPPNASGMGSLRYFDDQRPKNCYSLPVNASSYYMIRASFFYGNYDRNAKPPSFQLAMDGNIVANVTMTDSTSGQYLEFQYMPYYSDTLFLCLIRTSPLSTPFISGITLVQVTDYFRTREFSRDALQSGFILKTITRVNFGGTNLIRYPADSHDYMWQPQGANSALLKLTTSPIQALSTTDTITYLEIPPPVMQTAVTTSGKSLTSYFLAQGSADVGWPNVDLLGPYQSLSLYWAELNSSTSNIVRKFNLTTPAYPDWAGLSNLNGSYLSTSGYYVTDVNFTTSGPDDTFTLTNTNSSASSTLGPVVNALELYSKSDRRVLKTLPEDALEIESIEGILNLTEWTGDPCVPYPHTWLNCTYTDSTYFYPTIIGLNFAGYNLGGTISRLSENLVNLSTLTTLILANNHFIGGIPDLNHMTNLITLDLSNNNLNGTIPFWMTSLTKLRHLYLEGNNFNGPIPTQLLQSDTLDFVYFPGNSGLTGGVPLASSNSKSNSRTLAILGATLGSALGFLILAILAYCLYPWLKVQFPKVYRRNNLDSFNRGAKIYTLAEVTAMTRNFNQEIGKGGFGPVYYGKLPDGQEVAVKVADGSSRQGKKEFLNEVDVLSRVRHKNLVNLVGFCQEDGQQILIYEYMKNGSVHDQLFGDKVSSLGKLLDWKMRLKIGLDAAQGLEYLHTGCSPSFIHRDVKSSNILLSAKFDAKVADFGLTKLMGETDDTKVLTLVMGTAGYLDPEYYQSHLLSTKSDIYSFGVVLLELITGRLPITRSTVSGVASGRSNTNLCDWVRAGLEDGNLDAILDPAVRASVPVPNQDALWKVTEIALQCVEPKSIHRPTMTTVLQELHAAYNLEDPASSVQDESFGPFDYSGSEMGPLAR